MPGPRKLSAPHDSARFASATLYACALFLVGSLVGFLTVLLWAKPNSAFADDLPTLSGAWNASSMSEKWSTTDWGDACGPKPSSGGGAPGGAVTVTQTGGELSFSGAGRAYSTTQCWEQLPGMKRTSHSGGQRGWSSTCASAAGDPRRATVTTKHSATDTTIVFNEIGIYEFNIKDTACKASVSRSRSYKLQKRAGEEAPAATAEPSAAPPPPPAPTSAPPPAPTTAPNAECDPSGTVARFELKPARKLLRPAESFSLISTATDAKGCRLAVAPELKTEPGALGDKLSVERLTITAAADAPAGTANIVATLAGKSVTIVVEVALPQNYDELLKVRGLNAAGEDDRVLVAEVEAGLGGASSESEDTARARRWTFLAIVGGVAALLGFAALVLLRRGKRAHEHGAAQRSDDEPEPSNVAFFDAAPNKSLECPLCGRMFAVGEGFCAADGSALVPSQRPSLEPAPVAAPVAKRAVAAAAAPPTKRKAPDKICPTCGDRFGADDGFCGKDGTQLVPIN